MIESNFDRATYAVPMDPAINEISALLRGEISATEAYEQVMESMAHDPEAIRLQDFLDDHRNAVAYWKAQLNSQGVVAKNTSGPWGTAVETFVGAAKLLGNGVALAALKEGEEHGLNQYEEALEDEEISASQKAFIRDVLVPNQRKHVYTLEGLKKLH